MEFGKQANNRRANNIAYTSVRIRKAKTHASIYANIIRFLDGSPNDLWNQAGHTIIHVLSTSIINLKHSFFPKNDIVS